MEKIIKLNSDDILRLKITTDKGEDTGQYLEFDLEDVELPLKLQEILDKTRKNKQWLSNTLTIIDKKQDVKTDRLMSKNEEEKIKVINCFFRKQVEIFNIFLGENGVEKLLNGRKLGWTSLQEIEDIIAEQISPHITVEAKNVAEKIKEKYKNVISAEQGVLK